MAELKVVIQVSDDKEARLREIIEDGYPVDVISPRITEDIKNIVRRELASGGYDWGHSIPDVSIRMQKDE